MSDKPAMTKDKPVNAKETNVSKAISDKDARLLATRTLYFVMQDLRNCDWRCGRCGKDAEILDTDIAMRVKDALKSLLPRKPKQASK